MYEAGNTVRIASFEDRRMWRLLLARLHPDAGGDNDLFAFACAVRDEMSGGERPTEELSGEDGAGNTESKAPFLSTWHEAMGRWSSSNRDSLYNIGTR